jgi:hypothetical protein
MENLQVCDGFLVNKWKSRSKLKIVQAIPNITSNIFKRLHLLFDVVLFINVNILFIEYLIQTNYIGYTYIDKGRENNAKS